MSYTKWIIDKSMSNDFVKIELVNLIKYLGYEVTLMEYIPFTRKEDIKFPYDLDDCVIPYTTINLGRHLKGYFGSYLNEEELKFNNYYSKLKLPSEYWVNGDFVMTTYYDFETNFQKYVELFQTNKLFIRPNSGSKLFTGLPIHGIEDMKYQTNTLRYLSGVVDNSLILVSKSKLIKEEYRFLIVGNEVIDGSQYQLNGEQNELHFYTSEALALAELVAKSKDKPVDIFTVDIAKLDDGTVKIVELNSFNCAGWYAMDPSKIIINVSKFVEQSHRETYD